MAFKREKIRRSLLDEMEKTMSVIPISELMLMIGELSPGYYAAPNLNTLNSWLSSHVMDTENYREAVFYQFTDGTFGILILESNTSTQATVKKDKDASGQFSFSGKYFNAWGHTHMYQSTPTINSDGSPDDISTKNNIGLPTSIYFHGKYYSF